MDRIGRYKIIGELGRGAMGVVYHATDPAIGRSVAIKTIRIRDIHDAAQREKLRERLFREARSAGALSHPNIVTIYDIAEADGLAWIAMAYVNGPTLEQILNSDHPLSGTATLDILRQSASALDYAHSRGVVHRDIKPGNIMRDEDGTIKITDFGIARITSSAGNTTETRTVSGTPNYMSPEQVQGLPTDGRSDQFSLAVIAFEILTGERPFDGEHLSTVVYRIVAEAPLAAHQINATLTPAIDAVLRRGLAKRPAERFSNCASFVGALEIACAESRGWAPLVAGAAASLPTVGVPAASQPGPAAPVITSHSRREHRFPAGALALAVIVGLGLGGAVIWESAGRPGLETAVPVQPTPQPAPVAPEPPVPVEQSGKPSPLGGGDAAPSVPDTVVAEPPPVQPAPRPQDIWVATNPPGAKAVLDDDLKLACLTPCMLHGVPGTHHLTYSYAGYQNEYREIHVAETAMDAPLVTLRQPTGTLMLTTTQPGAGVRINGELQRQLTPAQIILPPGIYSVTVEKGGRSQTQKVEIQDGTVYLRIPLGP